MATRHKKLFSFLSISVLILISHDVWSQDLENLDSNLTPSLSSVTKTLARPAPANQEKLLVGLEVDGTEVNVLDVIQIGEDYLFPIKQVFSYIDVRDTVSDGELHLTSPSGEASIAIDETYFIDNEVWLSLSVLNDYLLVNAVFDQAKFALTLFPPWREKAGQKVLDTEELAIEYKPSIFSLRQFRLAHEIRTQENGPNTNASELLTSGSAYGGSWRFEAEKNPEQSWRPDNYFWLNRNANSQWLVGRQTITPSAIAPAVPITGVQYFSSNQDVPYDAYNDISQSNFFNQLGNSVQRINGTAEPGSIAELYVNGGLQAEIFVRLDGSYDFGEVQLSSSSFNEVEVVIKDLASRSIIERQNKTSANSEFILDAKQRVTSFALGLNGNLLDPDYQDQGEAGLLLYRYGITDRTTLEAGYLHADEGTATLGVASALGRNFTGVIRAANRNQANAGQIELNGYGTQWRLASFLRHQEAGFFNLGSSTSVSAESTTANANYYYTLSSRLRLELIGRYKDSGQSDDVRFVKPGFFYSPLSKLAIGARPESDGKYRSELIYTPNRWSRLRLTNQDNEQNAKFDWFKSDTRSYYYSFRRFDDLNNSSTFTDAVQEHALGIFWRPNEFDAYQHLRMEASQSNRFGAGAFVEYRTPVLPGVYLDLQASKGSQAFDGGLSAFARVAVDYSIIAGKFIPGKNQVSYNTRGSIAGRINTSTEHCDIEQISVLVDGRENKTRVQDCNFRLDNVLPGVHRVRLANEFLPIELIPESKQFVVLVSPSAVTKVDFSVSAEYSAAGRVVDLTGKGLANIQLVVFDSENKIVTQALTDQFGLFRVDSLTNGDYILRIDSDRTGPKRELSFTIQDDFLFGLDLTLD